MARSLTPIVDEVVSEVSTRVAPQSVSRSASALTESVNGRHTWTAPIRLIALIHTSVSMQCGKKSTIRSPRVIPSSRSAFAATTER